MQLLYILKSVLVLVALLSWTATTAHPIPPTINFRRSIDMLQTTFRSKVIHRVIPTAVQHVVNEAYKYCKHLPTNEAILRCCTERIPLAGFCLRSAKEALKLCADTPDHLPSDVQVCLNYKCV